MHATALRTLAVAAFSASLLVPLAATAQATIKIGFHAPLTGPTAADGKSAQLGAELAIEQINRAGGINGRKLELVVYDDQGKPEQAVPIANKLIGQDGVKVAVSGGYSGPSRSAAPIFQQNGIPYVTAYAIHPDITKAGDFAFRTASVGEVQGRGGAKLVGDNLKKKRVVLLTLKNDFGKALASGFKEAAPKFGVEITKEYEYSITDRQFGPLIASIKADNPEVIYATGYYFNAGPLVSQLRAAGVTATVVGQEGYDSQKFIEIAGKAAEGTLVTTALDRESASPETKSFLAEFPKKAGFKADMVAASTHAAVNVVAAAMKQAGPDNPKAIRDALAATNLPTAIGTLSFNSQREVKKAMQVQVVKDGDFRRYVVIDDPVLLAPPTN